jgi:ribosomal protein S18 acetylase RimI-like enzyme
MQLEGLPAAIRFETTNSFGLFEHGRLMAFGQLLRKDAARAYLCRIIVSPSSRRKGYGTRLVESLIETARARHHDRLHLWVDDTNRGAFAVYIRLGFREAQVPEGDWICPGSHFLECCL